MECDLLQYHNRNEERFMRAVYNAYNSNSSAITSNSYQQDKDQFTSLVDKMKKSIDKGDFESAQSLLEEANKLVDSSKRKRSSKINQLQTEIKSHLDTLSDSLNKKDKNSASATLSEITNELKANKNIVLKSHNSADIVSELKSKYLLSVYA